MTRLKSFGVALALLCASVLSITPVFAQEDAHEDLSACTGSAPEPTQSAPWSVAFCNRTGHDIVLELHDNDCPAKDWSRRGDVYQRLFKRGESKALSLCYANEAGKKPVAGNPTVRIPGGKGVTTTWTVVGDCGDHSKALNADARSYYDRGDYKTGIILLQYPAGAAHCSSEYADSTTANAQPPVPTHSPIATLSGAASSAPAAGATSNSAAAGAAGKAASLTAPPATSAPTRGAGEPTLTAAVDTADIVHRKVNVFAKNGAGYRCTFNLNLTFSDGTAWNDHGSADLSGSEDAPVAVRKYLKTVDKVAMTSSKCSPQH